MLGAAVARVLGEERSLEVTAADRARFEATSGDAGALLAETRAEWIVNAIGITAPHIDEGDRASVALAEAVNAAFPRRLAAAASERGARVIHLSTDGVFSGADGPYDEGDAPDATGVYARTKRAGEVDTTLRCSIVGVEPTGGTSLLAWVLSQPRGAELDGFANHRWNGVTTLAFARVRMMGPRRHRQIFCALTG